MHDVSQAEKVFNESDVHIGYIKQATDELWVPIDLDRETIAGPTYKLDAINIVNINSVKKIQP